MKPRLAIFALAGCGAAALASAAANDLPATDNISLLGEVLSSVERQPKPALFKSFQERLDYIHHNLYTDYNTRVVRTDAYFGRALEEREPPVPSRFRLGLFLEISQEDTTQFGFKPSFNAKIKLPNVERRFHIFVNTLRPTELPGVDPTEENQAMRVGVNALTHLPDISASAGARLTWLPEAFVELSWDPDWHLGSWMIRPMQNVFYETDDKFGEQTRLGVFRWFGARQQWAAGWMGAATWSQSSDGLEWEQTVKGGFVRELLEEKNRGRDVGGDDLAQGIGLRYSLFGSDKNFTEHRAMLTHRRPLYRRWIYLELTPGLKWRSERDWKCDPYILFGLDCLFWGTPQQ